MENFTNETIDTTQLPKFEEVQFTTLHSNYWKVTLINLFIFFLILGTVIGITMFFNEQLTDFYIEIIIVFYSYSFLY